MLIAKVAVQRPFFQIFDYLIPQQMDSTQLQPGCRVQVEFNHSIITALLLNISDHTDLNTKQLQPLLALIDQQPILDTHMLHLMQFAAQYYCHPIGEVLFHALPKWLRQGKAVPDLSKTVYQITASGIKKPLITLRRRQRQQRSLQIFQQQQQIDEHDLATHELTKTQLKPLLEQQWIEKKQVPTVIPTSEFLLAETPQQLTDEQQQVLIPFQKQQGFYPLLLEGVTGSGKTEVYLQACMPYLEKKQQILVLIPEIGLTPQTWQRFQQRFHLEVGLWHSRLTDQQRAITWAKVQKKQLQLIVGTRSSLFLPFQTLGLIIIDEEHDPSYKQTEGFKYHARDLAIYRAKLLAIPIILGSATPSIESLYNVQTQRYHHGQLTQRISQQRSTTTLVPISPEVQHHSGLSATLRQAISQTLAQQQQVLLFINRRGYAAALWCASCKTVHQCQHCSAAMTYHKQQQQLICHHCGFSQPIPHYCTQCSQQGLQPLGVGTEKLEERLLLEFTEYPILRIDRDSTRLKGQLEQALAQIEQGQPMIIIGTQMLAKGHHFPNIGLVGVIGIDSALYSHDYRAVERLAQLLTQVFGRTGRGQHQGQVLLQTALADNPTLRALIQQPYQQFVQHILQQRMQLSQPPIISTANIRIESTEEPRCLQAGQALFACLQPFGIEIVGPAPSPLQRKAKHYRYLLLLFSHKRGLIQQVFQQQLAQLTAIAKQHKVRWHMDIDPMTLE